MIGGPTTVVEANIVARRAGDARRPGGASAAMESCRARSRCRKAAMAHGRWRQSRRHRRRYGQRQKVEPLQEEPAAGRCSRVPKRRRARSGTHWRRLPIELSTRPAPTRNRAPITPRPQSSESRPEPRIARADAACGPSPRRKLQRIKAWPRWRIASEAALRKPGAPSESREARAPVTPPRATPTGELAATPEAMPTSAAPAPQPRAAGPPSRSRPAPKQNRIRAPRSTTTLKQEMASLLGRPTKQELNDQSFWPPRPVQYGGGLSSGTHCIGDGRSPRRISASISVRAPRPAGSTSASSN